MRRYQNFCFLQKELGFSAPKRPKLAFLVIFGQALPAHFVPCWWVGWWLRRAGCISQDTYLLYRYKNSRDIRIFSVSKLFGLKIRSCKIFDKFQVWTKYSFLSSRFGCMAVSFCPTTDETQFTFVQC